MFTYEGTNNLVSGAFLKRFSIYISTENISGQQFHKVQEY